MSDRKVQRQLAAFEDTTSACDFLTVVTEMQLVVFVLIFGLWFASHMCVMNG